MKFATHLAAALFAMATASSAATVELSFETLGATLGDQAEVTDSALASYGIRFRVNGNELANIAEVGGTRTAFYGPHAPGTPPGPDNLAPNYAAHAGNYFLTDNNVVARVDETILEIFYDEATRTAGGDILDVDYGESYTISLFNAANELLHEMSVDETTPGGGDGGLISWNYASDAANVSRVKIRGVRGTAVHFGLAFDNFRYETTQLTPTPSAVPAPLPAALLLSGLGIFGAMRRQRKS